MHTCVSACPEVGCAGTFPCMSLWLPAWDCRQPDWDNSIHFSIGRGIVVASKLLKDSEPTTRAVQGIDLRSGLPVWASPDIGTAISFYVPEEDALFVFESKGAVHAMDIQTGQKRWTLTQLTVTSAQQLMNPYVAFLQGSRFVALTDPKTVTVTAVSTILGTSCMSTLLPPAPPPVPPRPPHPPLAPAQPPAPAGPRGCWSYSTWNIAWGDLTHAVDDVAVYVSVSVACSPSFRVCHRQPDRRCCPLGDLGLTWQALKTPLHAGVVHALAG